MSRDPIALLRTTARRLAVVRAEGLDARIVFALERVPAAAFARMAGLAVGQARRDQDDEADIERRLAACKTEDERAVLLGEAEEVRRQQMAELLENPEHAADRVSEVTTRVDELVMSAVQGTGIALPNVAEGLVPAGTPVSEVCEPLGHLSDSADPVYLRTIDWRELPVGQIDYSTRMQLVGLIAEAYAPRKAVESFPGGSRAAGRG